MGEKPLEEKEKAPKHPHDFKLSDRKGWAIFSQLPGKQKFLSVFSSFFVKSPACDDSTTALLEAR